MAAEFGVGETTFAGRDDELAVQAELRAALVMLASAEHNRTASLELLLGSELPPDRSEWAADVTEQHERHLRALRAEQQALQEELKQSELSLF